MRVYYKIDGVEFPDNPQIQEEMGEVALNVHRNMLEALKYKIMWSLRSIENELDRSGGIIYIVSPRMGGGLSIELANIDHTMGEKINRLFVASGVFKV